MPPPARKPTGRPRPNGPWKNGPIPVIGLVGGIGAGKSAVAARLAGLGAFVIDADRVGHALLDQRPVRELVVKRFGPTVLAADPPEGEGIPPRVDRRALGTVVFKNPTALKALEAILHPRMRRTFEKAIARVARRGGSKAVVLDAAVLFEAGWDGLCDRVLFVDAPRPSRLARLAAQRGWDEAAVAARESAQWPPERKKERADAVVSNAAGPDELAAEVDRAWSAVLASRPRRPRPDAAPPGRRSPTAGRPARPRGR
jgi:dephospho-CoA kinase